MAVVRSLVFLLLVLLITPPYAVCILLCFPLPHRARRYSAVPWVKLVAWLIKHVLGIDYQVVGRENLPRTPVIILAKHQSAWETVVLQLVFPLALLVWKKELRWQLPFFGWALAVIPMIAVDRKAGKQALRDLVKQGRLRLSQGYSIVIFPEGTRTPPGKEQRFKVGGAYLAVEAGVPVVPVALNSGEYWGRNALFKRAGTITVSIGPTIDTQGQRADKVSAQAESWINQEMRRISPELYADAPRGAAASVQATQRMIQPAAAEQSADLP